MFVAILYGENTINLTRDEEDVFTQINIISKSLSNHGFKPIKIPFSLDITKTKSLLDEYCPIFVFNLVESIEGRGELSYIAPAILDYLKIPYTGSSKDAIYLTSNKILTKKLLKLSNIPTPPWLTMKEVIEGNITFEPPYIIKFISEDASVGISEHSIIYDKKQLREEIKEIYLNDGEVSFVEAYIDGREFNVSLLADIDAVEVLPPLEITFDNYPPGKARIVDYTAKWIEDSFEYNNTPKKFHFPPKDCLLIKKLSDIAKNCWDFFELKGYGRVDFRVDNKGNPYVLEINANPCLSPDSNFIAATDETGLDYGEIVSRIINEPIKNLEKVMSILIKS